MYLKVSHLYVTKPKKQTKNLNKFLQGIFGGKILKKLDIIVFQRYTSENLF